MRPQDLYPDLGDLVRHAATAADRVALVRADCEVWDTDHLRVDAGTQWGPAETHAAAIDDLAAAEEALRAAVGRLEGAWAAIGRLASD